MNSTEKLIGIIRTFHHQLYEDEEDNHDEENYEERTLSRTCFLVMISIAFMITGILSILYGYLLPYLYKLLETGHRKNALSTDTFNCTKYKYIFVMVGLCLSVFGSVICVLVLSLSLCKDSTQVNRRTKRHAHYSYSPMVIAYKAPP